MKIKIDYDFYDAIKDINQPLSPLKIIRNEILEYFILSSVSIPLVGIFCNLFNYNYDYKLILSVLGFLYGKQTIIDMAAQLLFKRLNENNLDSYADIATIRLTKLALLLEIINVKTNYELLLKSELYSKNYEFIHKDSLIPSLLTKKYFSIPSYNYNGDLIETSILQEHIIGTDDYFLSSDEPDRQYERVLVKSQ